MAESWQESEIIPGLFVGDLQDAQRFDGTIISVLPDVPEGEPPHAIQMPFLAQGVVTLDQTAALIDEELAQGHRVLVHCEEGCERAPLVVAWFLKNRRYDARPSVRAVEEPSADRCRSQALAGYPQSIATSKVYPAN
jgi:hypothetical protein